MKSLRGKFIATMLVVVGLVGIATLLLVALLNTKNSERYLETVRTHIEEGIKSKGRVLTTNHALAMHALVIDNAYLDIQRLVERAVQEDSDLRYGIYVSSEKQALAYCLRDTPCNVDKTVDKEVWRPLGIAESDLLVNTLQIREVNRLGTEILEVAMPVLGEETNVAGTIRYGLSTKRMHDALDAAKLDADQRLRRSLALIAAIVGLSTLLGLLLSRSQAVRITRPLLELTKAAGRLAAGNREVRVNIRSRDELEVLGNSFNQMVEELDASYRQLEDMNRNLEIKVEERTSELAAKNRDMRLVLDNVDQGLVTVSKDGLMALEHSKVIDDWFGASVNRTRFVDLLAQQSKRFAVEFQLALDQVIEGLLPLELTLDQLPHRLLAADRTLNLRYIPFLKNDEFDGMLVVFDDITEQLQKERDEAEQTELMQGFKRLMLDKSGFSSFMREACEMVDAITSPTAKDPIELKRTLHTLKGNSGVMGLTVVARLCHTLEEQIAETGTMNAETVEELTNRWAVIREHIASFAGTDRQRIIEVPQSEYVSLISQLSAEKHGEVLNRLLAWQLEPIAKPFERLGEQAKGLAHRLGKGEVNVSIDGKGVNLDPDTWSHFFSALVHLVRNSVDHGIESMQERQASGKEPVATIFFKATPGPQSFTLEIGDDGRGIDWDAIAEKAKSKQLPAQTQSDLLDALLTDGVTTKHEVTDVSGRGVGMSALVQRIRDMGGTLDVRSQRGTGTTWVITFPWNPAVVPTSRVRASSFPSKRQSLVPGAGRA